VLNRIYLAIGSIIPLAFAVMAFMGWELGGEPREKLDPSQPGGIRSHHFWYAGYHGGK
jgi:hypothetical protein